MALRSSTMAPDAANTTFCMGFWPIPGNAKRPLTHYQETIPRTLDLLQGQNLVFFHGDRASLDAVGRHRATGRFRSVRMEIEDLPAYDLAEDYVQACKRQDNDRLRQVERGNEKGLAHFERDYLQSGEDVYRKIITIWMSKLFLVEQVMRDDPFDTEFFAWVDATVARFNNKRANWNFIEQRYDNRHVHHYGNEMRYMGEKCRLNASLMFGHRDVMSRVVDLYRSQLYASRHSDYAHDEETILNMVCRDNGEWFRKIGDPIDRSRRHSRIRRTLKRTVSRVARFLKGPGSASTVGEHSHT
jgi:hypothetical protein